MTPTICLVHLGEAPPPDYLIDALHQAQLWNPSLQTYVACGRRHIGDLMDRVAETAIDVHRVTIVPAEELPVTSTHALFSGTHQLDESFRGGFWRLATERFFILEALMRAAELTDVFHLENDVMLYADLVGVLDRMPAWARLALIRDAPDRVIPGLMFVRSADDLARANLRLQSEAQHSRNDMESLALFLRDHRDEVLALPVVPPWYPERLPSGEFSRWFDAFGCIFDGAALGQYLGGIDPRNVPEPFTRRLVRHLRPSMDALAGRLGGPLRQASRIRAAMPGHTDHPTTPPFINETAMVSGDELEISWQSRPSDSGPLRRPVARVIATPSSPPVEIANLHIHSKRLHLFGSQVRFSQGDVVSGERLQELADVSLIPPSIQKYHRGIYRRLGSRRVVDSYKSLKTSDLDKLNHASSVFIYTHEMYRFIDLVWPQIRGGPYILVSHNSDDIVSDRHLEWLDSVGDRVVVWYAQNVIHPNPKVVPLPIGLANSQFAHGDVAVFYDLMCRAAKLRKSRLVSARFSSATQSGREDIRAALLAALPHDLETSLGRLTWEEYLDELARSSFSVCPPGNGIDTHRFWESLYLGAVPIVPDSWHARYWVDHHGVPSVIVSDWGEVTAESLTRAQSGRPDTRDVPILRMSYWSQRMAASREAVG